MRKLTVPFAAVLLVLGSCTAKYQDLLRDRDAQIRELEGANADLRAANADLQRQLATPRAEPASAVQPPSELERVQSELADLDVRYSGGRISIGIQNTVTFASGSTELKPGAGEVLSQVAAVLNRDFPDRRIYVEGHTDTDPIRKSKDRFRSNRHLSAERADVVAEYLVTRGGLAAERVVVVGFGPYDPRDPGASEAAKARNRRVEIVVGEIM